ncbi:pyrrolo-quinoline quinone [Planctomyces sp. SCGC AG-212-M04]|nr:pyrrolo-quinoline quinone [Planctomyces sp. SCGC AG-212-M04]
MNVVKHFGQALAVMAIAATVQSASAADSWPTFRGPGRTAVSPDKNLLEKWPEDGPPLVWTAKGAGRGYSSLAIAGGKIYTLGDNLSTASDKEEYLQCFDQKTGKQLWTHQTGSPWDKGSPDWQGSRSTPTVDGDSVYVVTPPGVLVACKTSDGSELFRVDLVKDYGGKKDDGWGYSESPTVDGDKVICTPGGKKSTMVAFNKKTGKEIWKTVLDDDSGAGHASTVVSKVGGTTVLVTTTGSGALGVRAEDGKLLWNYPLPHTTARIPTPIVRGDLVFCVFGYDPGGGVLLKQVPQPNKEAKVEEIYPLNGKLKNKHGGVVLVGDYLYGDSDAKGILYCAEFMTGKVLWTDKRSKAGGRGSAAIAAADGHLYVRYQNGVVVLAKADPTDYVEVGSFTPPGAGERPSWAHPVVVDGMLYLREGDSILCYDVREKPTRSNAGAQ